MGEQTRPGAGVIELVDLAAGTSVTYRPEDVVALIERLAAAEEVIHAEIAYRKARNSGRPSLTKPASERRAAARTTWHALGGTNTAEVVA